MTLDCRKHDFDVMERVLGGTRDDEGVRHTDLLRLEVSPWFAGTTTSVVEMTILEGDSGEAGEAPARSRIRR